MIARSWDPRVTVEVVTPEVAARWMRENNIANRSLRKAIVLRFASDMLHDRWPLTHQGIAFGPPPDCRLLDGQHRLAAVVHANRPVQMYVFRYPTEEAARAALVATDTGMRRDRGDILELTGTVSKGVGKDVAAIVAVLHALDANHGSGRVSTLSDAVIAAAVDGNRNGIQFALANAPKRPFAAPLRAALVYAHMTHPRECESFVAAVLDGSNLDEGTAANGFMRAVTRGSFTQFIRVGTDTRTKLAKIMLRILASHVRSERAPMSRLYVSEIGLDFFRHERARRGLPVAGIGVDR